MRERASVKWAVQKIHAAPTVLQRLGVSVAAAAVGDRAQINGWRRSVIARIGAALAGNGRGLRGDSGGA